MILVLADDFSGAAEMAGIAHTLGFTAEVQTRIHPHCKADILSVDTNTRSLSRQDAVSVLERMIPMIKQLKPSWIFKKVDSVLRGHVLAESEVLMHHLSLRSGILISANPSKQRMIRNGEYFIGDLPLNQTLFAHDPVFPAWSSKVLELLGKTEVLKCTRNSDPTAPYLDQEMRVPDIGNNREIEQWVNDLPSDLLAVGGVDFFSALLKKRSSAQFFARTSAPLPKARSRLLVCGSLAAIQSGRMSQCRDHGWSVHLLPEDWLNSKDPLLPKDWIQSVLKDLESTASCMIGIPDHFDNSGHHSSHPAQRMVAATFQLQRRKKMDQILVEGGETAVLLIETFDETRFAVLNSSSEGIPELVPFESQSPRILPKPGSYPWPDEFLATHPS